MGGGPVKAFLQRITGVKPKGDYVWVHADPDHPHCGISVVSQTKPEQRPAFKVTGITYEKARLEMIGKVLNWAFLKNVNLGNLVVDADKFKGWFR